YFVNSLFKQYGLIVLDADQRSLKEIFSPVIQDDIINQHSYRTISTTSKALGDLGFSSQVHPREINFFYLTDQFRERIVQTDDGDYEVLHQPIRWNKAELIKEIQQHPERFSPNRSEEHTSELQSRENLVCRLLLEKKKRYTR